MCGIAGLIPTNDAWLDTALFRRIFWSLRPRGPDDFGLLTTDGKDVWVARDQHCRSRDLKLALFSTRLSIIDTASTGWQPMWTEDGRYYIVFNGEIYNYVELRDQLASLGHAFSSRSDTEVLLKAFAEWGPACLNKLTGMFAFAVLDTRRRTLFLARDFFGIKPLYYTFGPDGFAFASETKTLLELPGVGRHAHPQAVHDYLHRGVTDHGPRTFFEEIRQLPPAHWMELSIDAPSPADPIRYWGVDEPRRLNLSPEEAAERLRELFLKNIRLHARSDVPIGATLSGGIDSSAIVMALRRHLGPRADLHVFSYIADDPTINEEPWIDHVAAAADCIVHKVRFTPQDLADDLDAVVRFQDYPFPTLSMFAEFQIYKAVHKAGVKVMLGGQGADEILGGYDACVGARTATLLRRGSMLRAYSFFKNASANLAGGRAGVLMIGLAHLLPDGLQGVSRKLVGRGPFPPWMNKPWFADAVAVDSKFTHRSDVLREMNRRLVFESGLCHHLRCEDRSSMSFSVESRQPFLTPDLVEFLMALPEHHLIEDSGLSKSVFRRAMADIIPEPVMSRRFKIGFQTPESALLRTSADWIGRVLASDVARSLPVFHHADLMKTWERMRGGQLDARVWRWVNFIKWAERFEVRFEPAAATPATTSVRSRATTGTSEAPPRTEYTQEEQASG